MTYLDRGTMPHFFNSPSSFLIYATTQIFWAGTLHPFKELTVAILKEVVQLNELCKHSNENSPVLGSASVNYTTTI